MLRGGGLRGLGPYDDGVHFGAALAVAHGLVPYRDFLFLQPPGVVVALLPFGWLARLTSDPTGIVAARVCWMGLGALNAVLVTRVLRPIGPGAAILAGLFYAVFWPAAFVERTVLLEPLGTALLLAGLLVGRFTQDPTTVAVRGMVCAGALVGTAASIKIWGVVPVLVLVGWLLAVGVRRGAVAFLAGAVGACAAVCLPFFLLAPTPMWQMVVVNQLGRRRFPWSPLERLHQMLGVPAPGGTDRITPLLVLALLAALVLIVLAWRLPEARPLVLLVVALAALLAVTPSWFRHYAGLVAAPVALTVGAGLHSAWELVRHRTASMVVGAPVLAVVAVACIAIPTFEAKAFRAYPGPAWGRLMAPTAGCVTTDEPMTLLQADLFSRNLERGCPLVLDLGGRSYHRGSPEWADVPRHRNRAWQAYALRYLKSGQYTIIGRFRAGSGFSRATAREVARWPVVARSGSITIRRPTG